MKRVFFVLITFLFLLTASCSTTTKPPEPPQNLNPEDRAHVNLGGNFVETEDGCYYLDIGQSLINFSPRGSATFYPLCNKPNCAHNDENCNAYCVNAFGYHNGFLYGITVDHNKGGEFELIRMNLDGSDHMVLAPLPVQGGAFRFYFHHGKLYIYCLGNYESLMEQDFDRFFVMDLDTYESRELFADFFLDGNRLSSLDFVEDKLYAPHQTFLPLSQIHA